MSDLTNYASGLTAYNNDGLELFIHTDGSAHCSKRAMARMLNAPITSLDRALKSDPNIAVVSAQVPTSQGLRTVSLYSADTLYDMAFKYNLPLAKQMGKMGANVYLYQLAGYKVSVAVEPKAPTNLRESSQAYLDQTKKLTEVLQQNIDLLDSIEANAGTANKVFNQTEDDGKLYFIEELFPMVGKEVPHMYVYRKVSDDLCRAVMNDTLSTVAKVKKPWRDGKGKLRYQVVRGYSLSVLPAFKNVCTNHGLL